MERRSSPVSGAMPPTMSAAFSFSASAREASSVAPVRERKKISVPVALWLRLALQWMLMKTSAWYFRASSVRRRRG